MINEGHFFIWSTSVAALTAADAGFEIHVAAPDDHVWAARGYSNDCIRELGFQYHRIPLNRRGSNPFEDFRTFVAIYRLIRQIRPNLVHLTTIKPILYGGLSARFLGIPTVATVAGLGHLFSSSALSTRFLRRLILRLYRISVGHRQAQLIFLNPSDRNQMIEGGVIALSQSHEVHGCGVDLKRFAARPQPSRRPEEPPLVILPARLIWEKGIDDFVAAARLLRKRAVRVRMALVGDTHPSNPRAVTEDQLRIWAAEGIVEWWGRREDMDAVMEQADIVCLPSRYGEGLPTVLAEAAASARATIASDIPGCRQTTIPGENGLLFPPGDVEALVEAIETLTRDPELRARFGAAGRRLAEERFSDQVIAQDHLGIYRRALSAARTPAK